MTGSLPCRQLRNVRKTRNRILLSSLPCRQLRNKPGAVTVVPISSLPCRQLRKKADKSELLGRLDKPVKSFAAVQAAQK